LAEDGLSKIPSVTDHVLFQKFFGEEVAVAVYPMDLTYVGLDNLLGLASNLIFVTRLQPQAQAIEAISTIFDYDGEVTKEAKSYKDHAFTVITFGERIPVKIVYVRIEDLLVISFDESTIYSVVDVFEQREPSLAEDAQYKKVQSRWVDAADSLFYANGEMFVAEMHDFVGGLASFFLRGKDYHNTIEVVLDKMQGLLGYSSNSQNPSHARLDLFYDADVLEPGLRAMYSCAASENKTISFIPKTVVAYQWNNCLHLEYYWDEINKEVEKAAVQNTEENVTNMVVMIESALGMSVQEDILPALGDESGAFLVGVDISNFPIPQLVLFIKVKNQDTIERLFDPLLAQPYVRIEEDDYQGVLIKYVPLPIGGTLQPAYGFFEDYLLVATSRQLIKTVIDVAQDPSLALLSNPHFAAVDAGLSDDNNSVAFIEVSQLMGIIKEVIEWGSDWFELSVKQKQAFQQGSQQRLADLTQEIERLTGELEDLKGMQGAEDVVEPQVIEKQNALKAAQEKQVELQEIVEKLQDKKSNSQLGRLYIREVVIPILEGLEVYQGFGSKVKTHKGFLEMDVFLKRGE